jgi:hypothetical protein
VTVKAFYRSDSGTQGVFEREIEVRMDLSMKRFDGMAATPWIAPPSLREMRVTLQPGQRWPRSLKKGTPIEYEVMGHKFVGVVTRRRLELLVCMGEFEKIGRKIASTEAQ